MYDDTNKRSEFYKDEEEVKKGRKALLKMKEMRERRSKDLVKIVLPNGTVISTTNPEKFKEYEQKCKRTVGYFYKPV
jgi:hypothetical protein